MKIKTRNCIEKEKYKYRDFYLESSKIIVKAALRLEEKRQNFFKECESTVTFRIGGFDWYDGFGTRQNGYTLPSYDHKINV